jgi:hypothetical protein
MSACATCDPDGRAQLAIDVEHDILKATYRRFMAETDPEQKGVAGKDFD